MKRLFTLVLAIGLLSQPLNLAAESSGNVSAVTKGLMCTCGCTMVLYSCQCGVADQMTEDIRGMLDAGLSKDEIFAKYVDENGQAILAAPPKEGFNLSAWILPFAALGIAGVIVVLVLRKWRSRGAEHIIPENSVNSTYLEEVERELEAIEEDYV
ncbi:MAG: cytochrome c-type biogenesis protein CcmH [Candidatus Marinimicrobia bacterium]|nr:cytochrome c-type biogenesis protein CcmH [Candidatus Neomarinimicrobiota bacterium]MCF7830336.1 cytochrome c-type biogenesis protein CcmH [Candidatus Neomarinimicrobiota bacterium]MCF7882405.1 cytochrome c-type biogenesis protein CcmH [Candidatus Neomarinimicrobiota bacterium]